MKKNKYFFFGTFIAMMIPHAAFAAIATFRDLIQQFILIMGNTMSLLFAFAFAGFFWGVFSFVLNGDDEKKRSEGKKWMMWSIIALFVMLTVWGIVGVLVNSFDIGTNVIPQLPHA